MLAAVGHPVRRLVRTQLGPLELGDLPAGASRSLTHEELAELRALCGLDAPPVDAADGPFLSSRDR
jgi:16S rRNA U516 pseudouridylate synthase RsuA-like enzyme